jgi:hypothetical protein
MSIADWARKPTSKPRRQLHLLRQNSLGSSLNHPNHRLCFFFVLVRGRLANITNVGMKMRWTPVARWTGARTI